MPIRLPQGLPVGPALRREGIAVVGPYTSRDLREQPLRLVLLNLMPNKSTTEHHFGRLLGGSERLVDLTLAIPDSYRPKTTPAAYLAAFYRPWSRVRERVFDGLIVTGAPVETLPFEEVAYWRELTEVFDWASANVPSSLYVCWAAQAALYHAHGVPKHALGEKAFGIHRHRVRAPAHPMLDGFTEPFDVPVSRHTEVRAADLAGLRGVRILADSPDTGPCLVDDRDRNALHMFNHLEYGTSTLKAEYLRDVARGLPVTPPANYFPDNDVEQAPVNRWRPNARRLFANWLDQIAPPCAELTAPVFRRVEASGGVAVLGA